MNHRRKKVLKLTLTFLWIDVLKIFNISNTNDDIFILEEYYLGDLRGNREKPGKQMG